MFFSVLATIALAAHAEAQTSLSIDSISIVAGTGTNKKIEVKGVINIDALEQAYVGFECKIEDPNKKNIFFGTGFAPAPKVGVKSNYTSVSLDTSVPGIYNVQVVLTYTDQWGDQIGIIKNGSIQY
ncbi:MAG: hypothetical protein L0Y72_28660 [Gemmataceae bacterium]|nr:hypothetical protein [Gemmataceae bacterium]MCI0743020.1 hypothetical protein [Gemmataceae bacterium]